MKDSRLPAGSIPWLLTHELRLRFRAMTADRRRRTSVAMIGVMGVVLMATAGVGAALWMRANPVRETPSVIVIMDLAVVAIFTLTLSQTLASATLLFHERGDLELLLSSPLPPRRILAVRAVAIAMPPFLWFAGAATLFIVPSAVLGQTRWLMVYPVLAATALLAAACGIAAAMALFDLIGPRRTRTVGQILAAAMGAAFFLGFQIPNLVPGRGGALLQGLMTWARGGVLAPASPLSWPARAVLGDVWPLCGYLGCALAVFMLVAAGLGRRFSENATVVSPMAPRRGARADVAGERGFGGGAFLAMTRKEWRLLRRDPALISQVLLRALYLLPLVLVLTRTQTRPGAGLPLAPMAGIVSLIAGQLGGSLAWITLSGEEAPDLVASAPVGGGAVRRAKLAAALTPVALIVAAPLAILTWLSPWVGLCAGLGSLASAASAGQVNLWFEKPTPRKAFLRRGGGSTLGAIAEVLLGLAWGVTTAVAAGESWWALAPLTITGLAMAALYGVAPKRR